MTTETKDNLASWLLEKQKKEQLNRKEYLAAFLAVRSDVVEARAAGYALKTIWEHMHEIGRVPFRYETFLRYVRRYITNAPAESGNPDV